MEWKQLTNEDWELILESLKYSKLKFEEYDKYPSLEYKQNRVDEITKVITKIKSQKK